MCVSSAHFVKILTENCVRDQQEIISITYQLSEILKF